MTKIGRPSPEEAAPYYHGYINQIQSDDILTALAENTQQMLDWLASISIEKWEYRYAPNKWTPKEVLLHLIDSERVFAYRALRIARTDTTPLPGFDQNIYVPSSKANDRSPESLIAEYVAVRNASMHLFQHLEEEAWDRQGEASGFPVSVRALAYILAGHEIHHKKIIEERYLA